MFDVGSKHIVVVNNLLFKRVPSLELIIQYLKLNTSQSQSLISESNLFIIHKSNECIFVIFTIFGQYII